MISDLHGRSVRLAERNAQEQTRRSGGAGASANAELTDAAHTWMRLMLGRRAPRPSWRP